MERVRRSLILTEVAEAENISVSDAEVGQEVESIASSAGPQAEEVRRIFAEGDGRDSLGRRLLTRKVLDHLVSIASGERTPDAGEQAETAALAEGEEEPS